jgi:hypothetical protein
VLATAPQLPARGVLLQTSPLLPSLWALGGLATVYSPAALLVRALWHRHEPQEPLRHTRNRSLPGAHLAEDLTLTGHCFGLAMAGASEAEAVVALRALGVSALAKRTKVSLARFARLVELTRDGLRAETALPGALHASSSEPRSASCSSASADAPMAARTHGHLPPAVCTGTVLMAFVWSAAVSKGDILAFLEAAASHVPPGTLLRAGGGGAAQHDDHAWRGEWLAACYQRTDVSDGLPAVVDAAASLAREDEAPP